MNQPPTLELQSVESLTRDQVALLYAELIRWSLTEFHILGLFVLKDEMAEVGRVNRIILSKWKPSGLEYIKNKAWKQLNVSEQ